MLNTGKKVSPWLNSAWVSKKCSLLLKYLILFQKNFAPWYIKSRAFVQYIGITDDVMSDDVIVDYIIAKNGLTGKCISF